MRLLLFTKHRRDLVSWLISALTRGSHVHAAILLPGPGNWIIEAFYPCVRMRQLADDELDGIDVFRIEGLTAADEEAIVEYARQAVLLKTPYSILNLFRFLAPLRAILGEGNRNAITDPTICSQFFMRAVGQRKVLLRAWPEDVDPTHLSWPAACLPQPKLLPLLQAAA